MGSSQQVKATIVMKAINKLGDLTDAKVIAELGNADSDLYKALNIHSSHIFNRRSAAVFKNKNPNMIFQGSLVSPHAQSIN